jgi:hypothetical protein
LKFHQQICVDSAYSFFFLQLPEDLDDNDKRRKVVYKIAKRINSALKKKDTEAVAQVKGELLHWQKQAEQKNSKKLSLTDSDAKFAQNKKKFFELGYNVQFTTEANGFLVSAFASEKIVDRGTLIENVNSVKTEFDVPKKTKVIADAGYESGEEIASLTSEGYELYIPTRASKGDKEHPFRQANFTYDKEQDQFVCPMGKRLNNYGTYSYKGKTRVTYSSKPNDCKACPHKLACCKTSNRKKFHISRHYSLLQKLRERMQDPLEYQVYHRRKETVERSIGDIKHNKNFRMFALRGRTKVQIEVDLMRIAHNLVLIKNRIGSYVKSNANYIRNSLNSIENILDFTQNMAF